MKYKREKKTLRVSFSRSSACFILILFPPLSFPFTFFTRHLSFSHTYTRIVVGIVCFSVVPPFRSFRVFLAIRFLSERIRFYADFAHNLHCTRTFFIVFFFSIALCSYWCMTLLFYQAQNKARTTNGAIKENKHTQRHNERDCKMND